MIELVFAVCLIDKPSHCRDVTLNFEGESISAAQGVSNGQLEMAKWCGEHPYWVVHQWRCGIAGQFAKL
jgi:hypothetical protein